MDEPLAIEASDLRKRFGRVQALAGLDLRVRRNRITGFLGPNGAGKTTAIRCILGLIRPDGGRLRVLGRSMPQDRRGALARIGAIIETPAHYPALSGRENLRLFARLLPDPRPVDEVLEFVDLVRDADRAVKTYSLGMKQRLGLARALLPRPELLILDEPTNGLDPAGIRDMRGLLERLCTEDQVSIFVSSHVLSEVALTAHDVVVVQGGKTRFQGPVQDLQRLTGTRLSIGTDNPARAAGVLADHTEVLETLPDGLLVALPPDVSAADRAARIAGFNRVLGEAGLAVHRLQPIETSLEDVFFHLTQDAA